MKNNINKGIKRIERDMAYQQLQCVDWLTVIAKLSGIDVSSKPLREIERKYFSDVYDNVDYEDLAKKLIATQKSILQKIPNEEGLCAINPTCIHREETVYLEDGLYKTVVDGYKVSKLEKIEEEDNSLTYTNEYISNDKVKINFNEDGSIKDLEVKDIGKLNKQFNKIGFLAKSPLSKEYKLGKYKHLSSNSFIEEKSIVVREDVYNYKLNSIVQQISIKKDSLDIDFKTRIVIKDKNVKAQIAFDSDDGFNSIADTWPGYETLYVAKNNDIEFVIFSIDTKEDKKLLKLESEGKGKFAWDYSIHINEVPWQDSNVAEIYHARSMPLIISNMMPKIRPIIELDNYGVLVTKVKLSSNGKYVLVTVKEMYDQECDFKIKAGFRAKGVYEIDKDHNLIAVTSPNILLKPKEEYNIAFEL